MPLCFSLVLKGINSYFSVVVALSDLLLHVVWSPFTSTPRPLTPYIPSLQKLVLKPRSPADVLASLRTSVSHPAPHFQMPCPPQPVSHVFCTALCVCHVHSVDTFSLLPPISPSHICIVSLCDLDWPLFFLTVPCFSKTGTCQICPLLKATNPHQSSLPGLVLNQHCTVKLTRPTRWCSSRLVIYCLTFRTEQRTLAKVSSS